MKISRYVFILGIVSLLTDISSEMIFPVLPIFLDRFLHATKTEIGLIEGVAIFIAGVFKVFSGVLSDRLGKRKILVVIGYSFSAFTKPLFYFANSWIQVLFLRGLERIGKGIRTAPRDAIISAYSSSEISGKSFGLHRALDTIGAVIGSLSAFLLLYLFGELEETFRKIFLISFIPAVLAIFILVVFVKEPPVKKVENFTKLDFKLLPKNFYVFLSIHAFFTVFSMNYAFFILKGNASGISMLHIPIVYLMFNISYAFFSLPFGVLSDRVGKVKSLLFVYLMFSVVSLFFLFNSPLMGWIGFIMYGIFISGYEVVSRAFISDITDINIKGTAYGVFHTLIGFSSFISTVLAGILWDNFGEDIPFAISFTGGLISLFATLFLLKENRFKT